jgi:hypothetical protein
MHTFFLPLSIAPCLPHAFPSLVPSDDACVLGVFFPVHVAFPPLVLFNLLRNYMHYLVLWYLI